MNIKKIAQLLLLVATASLTMASACSKDEEDEPSGQSSRVDNSNADWVDLGLPSGLLWARCNVGATKPEEYGDYFAWGETQPKSVYDWETYAYGGEDDGFVWITKYGDIYGPNGFTDDGLTTLQASDDAATSVLGGGARTPTREEWEDLLNNCTNEWISLNGVWGRCFTGPNGNSLFLPAAGYRWRSELHFAGYDGCYWSSSRGTFNTPSIFSFHSEYADMNGGDRPMGFSVRPVRSAH